ncbi:hypothetical protein ABVT39_008327 [Epinephelus coioides]
MAQAFDVPKATVFRVVHRIAKEIRNARSKVIIFPARNTLEEVGQEFGQLAWHKAFTKAVRTIDGCHIRIKPPSRNKACYYNYKGYFLVGDGGYPCIEQPITIVTPFRRQLPGVMEERFNKVHGRAPSIIERSFGLMKARWRATLFKALEVRPHFVSEVALACTFLHNICLARRDVMEEEELQPEDPGPPAPADQRHMEESSGDHIRARLCAQVSAPQQRHNALVDHDYTMG